MLMLMPAAIDCRCRFAAPYDIASHRYYAILFRRCLRRQRFRFFSLFRRQRC